MIKFKYHIFLLLLVHIPLLLSAKEKIISLKKQMLQLPPAGFVVENVINASYDDMYIGFDLSTANYQKQPVRFAKNIKDEFMFLFNKAEVQNAHKKIIIRINWIFLYEIQLEENTLSATELNLSFIEKKDTSYVELYRGAVSVNEFHDQKKNIVKAIETCFDNFYHRYSENKLIPAEYPIRTLMDNPLKNEDIQSFMQTFRDYKGIFRTYDDFYYNTADIRTPFSIIYKDKIDKNDSLIIKHAKAYNLSTTQKTSLDAWGFADSGRLFTRIGDRFFQLYPYDDGYYLQFRAENNSAENMGAAIGGMMFGLVGGIISYAIINAVPDASTNNQLLYFNLKSGSFDVFLGENEKAVESNVIFYSPAENDQDFELIVNGKSKCILQPDNWYEMSFPPAAKSIDVQIKSKDGVFEEDISPRLLYTDVYICYQRKNKPPFFRKVSYNTTKSTLEKLVDKNRIE